MKNLEELTEIEYKISSSIDLLEIAKTYCEFNDDKPSKTTTLVPILEILLNTQKDLVNSLDSILAE